MDFILKLMAMMMLIIIVENLVVGRTFNGVIF